MISIWALAAIAALGVVTGFYLGRAYEIVQQIKEAP